MFLFSFPDVDAFSSSNTCRGQSSAMKCYDVVFYFWLVFNPVEHQFVLRIEGKYSSLQRMATSGCHPMRPVKIGIILLFDVSCHVCK